MAELHDLSALDQAAAIRVGDISAVELTKHYLARSESLGRAVGAFILLTPELALVQAQAADDAVRRGDPNLGPLHGVVVPIKDLNNVSGVPTTYGAGLPAATAAADDYVVARMREAFLVFTGKTNTPEFGLPCYTENSIAEAARTPWDLTRSAGGSSGGSAAAVAAGLASVGQGNDGGGSIRIPASVCGLVGLKPSRHRISNGPWGDSVGELSVEGPLGRTVADVAALLDVMAVPFVDDPVILERSEGGFLAAARRTPHRLRIGRYRQPVIANVEIAADCLAGYEETSSLLAELGLDDVGRACVVDSGARRGGGSIGAAYEVAPRSRPAADRWGSDLRRRFNQIPDEVGSAGFGPVRRCPDADVGGPARSGRTIAE
jgi:amidase